MASAQAWYARYFGADYLRIYRLADTGEQLAFLREALADLAPGARVLDLPCGHGRHAVELARWGWRVVGVDLSPTFLATAAAAAAHAGQRLALVRGDMRRFPLSDAAFPAAICMFTSLGYFSDDAQHQAVLDEFARVLMPRGRFVLDLANIDAVRAQPTSAEWERDGVRVRSRYLWDEATRRATTQREAVFADGRVEHYESSVRLFEAAEIETMLARAGLAIERVQGAYTGGPVTPESRRRILICARGEHA